MSGFFLRSDRRSTGHWLQLGSLILCFGLLIPVVPTIGQAERSKPGKPVLTSALFGQFQPFTKFSTNGQNKIWINFTDKGIPDSETVGQALSRINRSDLLELPVYPGYISTIQSRSTCVHHQSRWLNAISATIKTEDLPYISDLPFVRSIEPVKHYRTVERRPDPLWLNSSTSIGQLPSAPNNDPPNMVLNYGLADRQMKQIQADQLHSKGFWGEGVIIGLLDTGFDLRHQTFAEIDVIAEWDFVNNDNQTHDQLNQDDAGQADHGSITLGVLAANTPNQMIGVAPKARYLLAKTEKNWEKGVDFERQVEEDWWIAGLEWLEQNGADIVNSSLGYSNWYTFTDLDGKTSKITIAANIALGKGLPIITAAGNLGRKRPNDQQPGLAGRITVPADGFDVLAIGSTNLWGGRATFSSKGPTADGRIKPDLATLGENIASIKPRSKFGFATNHRGTSLSTPLATGVAVLLLQAFPRATAKDLVRALRSTATNTDTPNNEIGYGLIQAELAYKSLLDQFQHTGKPEPISVDADKQQYTLFGQIKSPMLLPNYPNPFNAETWIPFALPRDGYVEMVVYDLSGHLVQKINLGQRPAGDYFTPDRAAYWNGRNIAGEAISSGTYFAVLSVDEQAYISQKMILQE